MNKQTEKLRESLADWIAVSKYGHRFHHAIPSAQSRLLRQADSVLSILAEQGMGWRVGNWIKEPSDNSIPDFVVEFIPAEANSERLQS